MTAQVFNGSVDYMSTLQFFERISGRSLYRNREQGSLSVELAVAIPIVVLVTLFVVQGFMAVSVVSSTEKVLEPLCRIEPRSTMRLLKHCPTGWL